MAYKQYDLSVDRIIPQGTTVQHIASRPNKGVTDAFYTSFGKRDNNTYIGQYGMALRTTKPGSEVYKGSYTVLKDVKVASAKSAIPALKNAFAKDQALKSKLEYTLLQQQAAGGLGPKQAKIVKRALADLGRGEITKDVSMAYNLAVPTLNLTYARGASGINVVSAVNSELKKLGYGAMRDINDNWLSGYNTKSANIFINGVNDLSVKAVTKVADSEIAQQFINKQAQMRLGSIAIGVAGYAGAIAAIDRLSYINSNNKILEQYKKEHPNTKMTDNEILENHYRK